MTVVADPIIVTEAAADKITKLLDEEKKEDGGLRVFVQGGGCSGFQYGLMIEEGVGGDGNILIVPPSHPSPCSTSCSRAMNSPHHSMPML